MWTNAIRLSLNYFVNVFACGFIMGVLRVICLQPQLGVRYAELVEMPFMVLASWVIANRVVSQQDVASMTNPGNNWGLVTGLMAVVWLLMAELGTSAMLRDGWNGVWAFFTHRDLISGPAYGVAVLAYMMMPWYVWPEPKKPSEQQSQPIECKKEDADPVNDDSEIPHISDISQPEFEVQQT